MNRNFEAAAANMRERMARARRGCAYVGCARWFTARRDDQRFCRNGCACADLYRRNLHAPAAPVHRGLRSSLGEPRRDFREGRPA